MGTLHVLGRGQLDGAALHQHAPARLVDIADGVDLNLTGVRAADRLPARSLLRWFAALLVLVAVYTGIQAGIAMH